MNIKRKVLVLFAVLILILSMLAACGSEEEKEPEEQEEQVELDNSADQTEPEMNEESDTPTPETDGESDVAAPEDDPDNSVLHNGTEEEGASIDISTIVNEHENTEVTHGIDVSTYQGIIDWEKVADAGVDFAIIRVGYRTLKDGKIVADTNAKYNMQEAQANGIKVGVYFFSTAISEEEAIEEADWVAEFVAKYRITYPVVYDCEGFKNIDSRQFLMNKGDRTDAALAFLGRIEEHGYTPMFYAARGELENDSDWETTRIAPTYKVWVAQYVSIPYPETKASTYPGEHAMWQHTNKGTVPGVGIPVDVNVAYFGYDQEAQPKDPVAPEHVEADMEALMTFESVNEEVTAKQETNLRDRPSQDENSQVLRVLKNGEVATRTGVSQSGWSRLEFEGETYYAVSSYLTTDLSFEVPEEDGVRTVFTEINDKVTAKEEVNLRTKPSVDDEIGEVAATLFYGEVITRTGVNEELGWSRVEYNGEVLYCITSYLLILEE